ncbi:hypothetical protein DFW101_2000 [Solidesulfovibrio carbinoliphilus subsp. oakridgensis]|uniref:Uncharacterized protein n=1 Tax=Solidesulfovibrio carbinoliphilus subsp. oakridgensis TaxID=694327 RepID=G7Q6S1_9BACT|nr:hypothetical protein [Solidesulfovibrio carbinoliphilus]EHJ48006.1 hypothetical protein DFW101_2000 [Solidesulfovibrio carbinoliphilus subsp. oakridgensis]
MTNMRFPFGDESHVIASLLSGHRYRAVANRRGQCYYQGRTFWRGMPVHCRLGAVGLARLPGDLYEAVWAGYYDLREPDSMLFDEIHANIFAFLKRHHPSPRR